MSFSLLGRENRGAYAEPFSGVGIEYEPLGALPDRTGLVLHECGYAEALRDWNFRAVFSPFWRVYYNRRRGHRIRHAGGCVELGPERLVVVPPNCLFHCEGLKPVPALWLAFSFNRRLHPTHEAPVILRPRRTELCLIRDLSMLIEVNAGLRPTDAILRHSLALLQVVLSRLEQQWQPTLPENLLRVQRLIEQHVGRTFSTPWLAQEAGLSVSGFNRAFRREFGTSPAKYVAKIRVREAARLLLQGTESLEAIADRTGFPDRAYFSRVFRKITGEPPAGFRRRYARDAYVGGALMA